MQVRKVVAAAALTGALACGIAACGDDDNSSASDLGASASKAVNAASSAVSNGYDRASSAVVQATTLSTDDAQKILRTVVDPNTSAEDAAKQVDSSDASMGQQLHGFAQGASQGGYTPEAFTVTKVTANGTDKATADVSVKSPHAPQPVTVQYGYTKVDGDWKLSEDAAKSLLSMAGGPH